MLPKIHPHQLEKAVRLSDEYCHINVFRRSILEISNECPVLLYQLHKRCVFEFNEIYPFLGNRNIFLLCFYFRNNTEDFEDQT